MKLGTPLEVILYVVAAIGWGTLIGFGVGAWDDNGTSKPAVPVERHTEPSAHDTMPGDIVFEVSSLGEDRAVKNLIIIRHPEIMTYEGCEYLMYFQVQNSGEEVAAITHKGNCKNH